MTPRILVVEDEVLIAMLVADAIESAGLDVVGPCQTVAQALAQLADPDCCDAAVLDAALRGESALPVATRLAELGIGFVVTTGYDASQLPEALASAPLLAKPLDTDALVQQLRMIVAGKPGPG